MVFKEANELSFFVFQKKKTTVNHILCNKRIKVPLILERKLIAVCKCLLQLKL